MPNNAYDPATILRVLTGREQSRPRPARHVEDVPDPTWLALSLRARRLGHGGTPAVSWLGARQRVS